MKNSENGARSSCPYFLQEMQACGLHSDGIYLPSRVHLLTYCLTPMYRECSTYERYCLAEKLHMVESERENSGRRRFMRIPRQRQVLIRSCDNLGVVTGDFAAKAKTLDYSQGGMRIIMEKEIPEGSIVLFDFDDDFLIPNLQGIAQLCWRRKLDDQPEGIEAGLAFKDNFSQAVLSVELQE